MTRRRFLAGSITGLAALAVPPARASLYPTPVANGEVFIVGDSLTLAMVPFLDDHLKPRGWSYRVDAQNNRKFSEGLRILRSNAWTLPFTVMVALGTNDMFASLDQFAWWVAEARDIVGRNRRLIFVNLYADDIAVPSRRVYRAVNAKLADAARFHAAELADWESFVSQNGVRTMWDGVHYDAENSARRARFTADALELARPPRVQ